MSLTNVVAQPQTKREYPLPKKGLRLAVLSGIIDVGIQQREFKGEPKKPSREVVFQYTLANDTFVDDDGNKRHLKISDGPFGLFPGNDKGKYMRHVKALDPDCKYVSAAGTGDVTKLIGLPVFLTIEHKEPNAEGKIYANITGLAQLPEDYQVPVVPFEPVLFDSTSPTLEAAVTLSNYQKDTIRKSLNYSGSALEKVIEASAKDGARDAVKDAKVAKGATKHAPPVDDSNDDDYDPESPV